MRTLLIASALLIATPALAANDTHSTHHNAPVASAKQIKNPVVKAYIKANKKMHRGMNIAYTGDPDVDFVAGMIPHHQGAVDMAHIELKYGKDEEMRKLAQWIITGQTEESAMMTSWLAGRQSKWRAPDAERRPSTIGLKKAMENMHHTMHITYTGNPDVDFARGMIPHHQGAVDMAAAYKPYGKYQQFETLADNIIGSQTQEIRLMQEWLDKQPSSKHKKKHDHTSH